MINVDCVIYSSRVELLISGVYSVSQNPVVASYKSRSHNFSFPALIFRKPVTQTWKGFPKACFSMDVSICCVRVK